MPGMKKYSSPPGERAAADPSPAGGHQLPIVPGVDARLDEGAESGHVPMELAEPA
jgi:hypothetical protein